MLNSLAGSDIEKEILSLMQKAKLLGIKVTVINGPSLSIHGGKVTELYGCAYYASPTKHIAVS